MTPRNPVRQPEYEYQSLRMPRGTTRNAARQLLTEHAEYGHWELDRLRLFPDGSRTVRLKRRIIRQVRNW
ncbi:MULTISPECIES: DUF5703 family protein [Streptomyces]|uniref:DUF5703 family protein n=1 Tax=Streptomyces TaxID=1883 RepID=UPI0005256DA6|nr:MULTISPECIES: DUF5703 family protein [Streptomyces]